MKILRFFISFSERSGSTHLVSLLNSHPQIECKFEVFSFIKNDITNKFERKIKTENEALSILNKLHSLGRRKSTNKNIALGFKFKYPNQYLKYPEIHSKLLSESNDTKLIFLIRQNKLKQAISKQIMSHALSSGHNSNLRKSNNYKPPPFLLNLNKTKYYIDKMENADSFYLNQLKEFRHSHLVAYESLLSYPEETLSDLFQFLEVASYTNTISRFKKITPDKISKVIINHEELISDFKDTKYEKYLEFDY